MKSKLISQLSLEYNEYLFHYILKKQRQHVMWNIVSNPYYNKLLGVS